MCGETALAFYGQASPDGLQLTGLPEETCSKTVTRKKKGIAGRFGAKETVEVTPSFSATLHTLNKEQLSSSYLIILRDLYERARTRKRLEETIEQNAALLEMCKNIIFTMSHDISPRSFSGRTILL